MNLTPEQAARGLALMQNLPKYNEDLIERYRDLTEFPVFKNCKVINLYDDNSSTSSLEK